MGICQSQKYDLNGWKIEIFLHALLVLTGVLALFFLFTNGIPLIQWGWIAELGKKSRYVRLMLVSVSIFSGLMIFCWWKFRDVFNQSFWVRVWDAACRIPLRHTTLFFFLAYSCVMTAVGFERHLALETRAFDLGIFAQAVWNTMRGDIFFSSIKENINLMGDHVSPILALTVPFYALWPDPRTLILLQALASASCFFPLGLIARDKLRDRGIVLVFLLLYFLYQPTRAALHEDFHPEVLAEPFLWWAFYCLDRNQSLRFFCCLAVAATGKENFLGIAFMLGFYAFFWKRMAVTGIFVMAAAGALFLWETKWLVPFLTGKKYFYGANYIGMLGDPFKQIILRLFGPESLEYILKVYIPFLFLPFFHAPTLVLTLPVLLQNLLSSAGSMRSFNYHYMTGLTPFLFISTLCAMASLSKRSPRFAKHIVPFCFLLLSIGALRSGPSEYYFFWQIHSHRNEHTEMVRQKLKEIPEGARVLTHNSFIPQLCNRKFVYQFNYNPDPTKIQQATDYYRADYVIGDRMAWEPNTKSPEETLVEAKRAGYVAVFERDGLFILKKEWYEAGTEPK